MSPLDRPVPPAGEEIHLPGPSMQPFLLAVFITMTLIGVTITWYFTIAGGIGLVWTLFLWIRDTRREMAELPLHHDQH